MRNNFSFSSVLAKLHRPFSCRAVRCTSHKPKVTPIISAINVALETPATPKPRPTTNHRSKTMLMAFNRTCVISAARAFCMPKNQPSITKLRKVVGAHQIRMKKYSKAIGLTSSLAPVQSNTYRLMGIYRSINEVPITRAISMPRINQARTSSSLRAPWDCAVKPVVPMRKNIMLEKNDAKDQ